MAKKKKWSELPEEILGMIARRLPEVEDIVRFSIVCRSWRSVIVQSHYFSASLASRLPWLMLPCGRSSDNNTRNFFSLSEKKVYELNLRETHGRKCWGSNYGWLITVSPNFEIQLLNPLSRLQICLPPNPPIRSEVLSNYLDWIYMPRANLFLTSPSSTTDDRFMVMLISENKLLFAKPGDKAWKCIEVPVDVRGFADITYLDGHFYIVDHNGTVLICEVNDPNPKAKFFAASPSPRQLPTIHRSYSYVTDRKIYLMESLGDIYMIVHTLRTYYVYDPIDRPESETLDLKIYKLDLCNRKWEKVKRLGKRAFFVSDNSLSICTSDYLECRSNCIYFPALGAHGFEVFNLEDNSIEPHHIENIFIGVCQWMTPSLF